jgi:hypothetical protein
MPLMGRCNDGIAVVLRGVVRRGAVVSRTPAATATLSLPGRPAQIDWTLGRATSPDTAT